MSIDELLTQFSTDLGTDVEAIRTALKSKGVSDTDNLLLSGVADKINEIPQKYTGTITVNYPTSWVSGYIYYKKKGVSGAAKSIVCNGSGKATITVDEPGTYQITNSRQSSDLSEVTFNA